MATESNVSDEKTFALPLLIVAVPLVAGITMPIELALSCYLLSANAPTHSCANAPPPMVNPAANAVLANNDKLRGLRAMAGLVDWETHCIRTPKRNIIVRATAERLRA